MQPALLIRLRPLGPWRFGPADGAHDRVDTLFRSDRLFSAVTLAMQRLGSLHEWLQATALNPEPEIVFSSLFPFQGDTLFVTPPVTHWPPPPAQVAAPNPVFLAKIRWSSVSFVPLAVVDTLLTGGQIMAEQWLPDSESGCLLRRDRPSSSPFRIMVRRSAAVDRLRRAGDASAGAACVEFEPGAGLWAVARYRDTTVEAAWREPVEAAFRLLSDTGFGGRRTSGWGQASAPEFERGVWPGLILPRVDRLDRSRKSLDNGEEPRYWMLALYSPAESDQIDWSRGDYRVIVRAGRVESNGASGTMKKSARMVEEGSVLAAAGEPQGAAVNVAPDGFAHPVYRSGLALALELPQVQLQANAEESRPVEEPSTEEAIIEPVCEPADREADLIVTSSAAEAGAHREESPEEEKPLAEAATEGETAEPLAQEEHAGSKEEHTMAGQPDKQSNTPQMEEIEPASEVQPEPEAESQPPVPSEEAEPLATEVEEPAKASPANKPAESSEAAHPTEEPHVDAV